MKILVPLFFAAALCCAAGVSGREVQKRSVSVIIREAEALQKSKGARAAAQFYMAEASRPEVSMTDTRKLLNLAAALMISTDPELAFQCARRALLAPSRNRAEYQRSFILLGRCYARAGCHRHAIGACRNATYDPKSGHPSMTYSAWYHMGLSHMALKEYKEARHAFNEALRAGKRVPYRFNYKPAERMLERIKNK